MRDRNIELHKMKKVAEWILVIRICDIDKYNKAEVIVRNIEFEIKNNESFFFVRQLLFKRVDVLLKNTL